MIITYAIMAMIATVLLVGYFALVRKKEPWLLLLYVCVTIINVGYFLLSISKTVEFAIFANDVAYFGSVFLSMSMLLTIVKLCGFEVKKKMIVTLGSIGFVMFLIVATVGILPWYYKEVDLVFVDGAAKLKKVYGVLHPVYLVYLVGYFAAMVACIVQSIRKNMIASQRHASLIAAIVFGNIAVWFVEKFIPWDFEFLSVSYIFSEIILLGLYWMMQDYVRVDLVAAQTQEVTRPAPIDIATMPMEEKYSRYFPSSRRESCSQQESEKFLKWFSKTKREKKLPMSFVSRKTPSRPTQERCTASLVSAHARSYTHY